MIVHFCDQCRTSRSVLTFTRDMYSNFKPQAMHKSKPMSKHLLDELFVLLGQKGSGLPRIDGNLQVSLCESCFILYIKKILVSYAANMEHVFFLMT